MTVPRALRRFGFAYTPAFAGLYALALVKDLALITVYPSLGIFVFGTWHAQDAAPSLGGVPAMYWYGWTTTAALGALIGSAVAAALPWRLTPRISPAWLWIAPAVAFLGLFLLYPAVRTVYLSFFDARSQSFVGLDNYRYYFTAADTALDDARRHGVHGGAVTPYLLTAVGRATEGRTLGANVALLEANAGLAAEIAVACSSTPRTMAPRS